MKERNLDVVINRKARLGVASTRGCEVRKLDFKHCQKSRKKRSPQKRQSREKRRNKKRTPSVSVIVYLNGNESSDVSLPMSSRQGEGSIVEALGNLRISGSAVGTSRNNEDFLRSSRPSSGNEKSSWINCCLQESKMYLYTNLNG